MTRQINGYHVAGIFGGAFSVIIAVNVVLATQAVRTFPGLEVKNSYVASQSFDADRTAQEALGWKTRLAFADGRLQLDIAGPYGPADARIVEAKLGRTTYAGEDRLVEFRREGESFAADAPGLGGGAWHLWVKAEAADGTPFRQRLDFWVPR